MNTTIRNLALTTSGVVLAFAAFIPAISAADTAPTLTANQTVANVVEVKASRILNVATVPVTTNTLTIGNCAVTFATTSSGSPAQDLNCNGGATITTATTTSDVAKTAPEIATALANLTNATSTAHGTLSVAIGTTTSKVVFTTSGTETSGTNINFTDGTSGKVLSAGDVTGAVKVAQIVTFTPADVRRGDFTVTINGTDYKYQMPLNAAQTAQSVVEGLNTLLSGNATVSCTENDSVLSCTALTAGTSFTYSSSVLDLGASSGSGGGGGSSHHKSGQSTLPVTTTGSVSTTVSSDIASQIAAIKAQIAALMAQAGGSTSAGTSVSAAFARDLEVGSTGADVMSLQAYLNAHGAVVATTGAGSVGNETTTFGPATHAALVKFQAAAGISPTSGYFGPKTRAYVQAH